MNYFRSLLELVDSLSTSNDSKDENIVQQKFPRQDRMVPCRYRASSRGANIPLHATLAERLHVFAGYFLLTLTHVKRLHLFDTTPVDRLHVHVGSIPD
jgi:hypothetical protein